jgi:membrane associated rhomboid family serine protease
MNRGNRATGAAMSVVFVGTYLFFGTELGYTRESAWWTHFTYMFQHAGWIHLIVNGISFFGVWRTLSRFVPAWRLATAFPIAAAGSFFCAHDLPTVGASGVVYALLGCFVALLAQRRIRFTEKGRPAVFVASLVLALAWSAVRRESNFELHVFAFGVMGVFCMRYEI